MRVYLFSLYVVQLLTPRGFSFQFTLAFRLLAKRRFDFIGDNIEISISVNTNTSEDIDMSQSESSNTMLANIVVQHAETPTQLANCFSVISRLRPALKDEDEWVIRALFMRQHDYHVLVAWHNDKALAVAGYHFMENLIHGNFIYVDDLVTAEGQRSRGLGSTLLTELTNIGKRHQCDRLVLDTLATNTQARRFYQREGLNDAIVGFYKTL